MSIKKIPPPTSPWKPKDAIKSPVEEMTSIDPAKVRTVDVYKLLIGCIVPRPIAFVSTEGKNGSRNLAPFSFFNGVSSKPPCLMISVSNKPNGEKKDTLRNIEESGEFVVNSANEWMAEPMVHCASAYPYGVNEMEALGFTPLPSLRVKPPRVKEAAIHFECKVHKLVQVGDGSAGSATLVIGEILLIHIDSRAYKDGKVLYEEIQAIPRLGGYSYGRINEIYEIPVPEV